VHSKSSSSYKSTEETSSSDDGPFKRQITAELLKLKEVIGIRVCVVLTTRKGSRGIEKEVGGYELYQPTAVCRKAETGE
jgi:hypothetical protein